MRSLVNKAFHQIRTTGRLQLFRSHRPDFAHGEQRRDFLYVKDAVAMTTHLALHPDAAGLYNIGSGHAHSWLELARAIFSALDAEPQIEFIDMPETRRPKYQYHTRAELDRLRATGYGAPATPLDEAVGDYIRHYLAPGRRLGEE